MKKQKKAKYKSGDEIKEHQSEVVKMRDNRQTASGVNWNDPAEISKPVK